MRRLAHTAKSFGCHFSAHISESAVAACERAATRRISLCSTQVGKSQSVGIAGIAVLHTAVDVAFRHCSCCHRCGRTQLPCQQHVDSTSFKLWVSAPFDDAKGPVPPCQVRLLPTLIQSFASRRSGMREKEIWRLFKTPACSTNPWRSTDRRLSILPARPSDKLCYSIWRCSTVRGA